MTDMLSVVARAIALWVGYMGVLDTMPPGDPGDPRNEKWVEINFRPFLSAAVAAIEVYREPTDEMVLAAAGVLIEEVKLGGLEPDCDDRTDAVVLRMLQKAADVALEGK